MLGTVHLVKSPWLGRLWVLVGSHGHYSNKWTYCARRIVFQTVSARTSVFLSALVPGASFHGDCWSPETLYWSRGRQ